MTDCHRNRKKQRACCEEKFDEGDRGDPNVFWFTDEMQNRLLRDIESRNGDRITVRFVDLCSSDPEFCGPLGSENCHFLNDMLECCKTVNVTECVGMIQLLGISVNEDTHRELCKEDVMVNAEDTQQHKHEAADDGMAPFQAS